MADPTTPAIPAADADAVTGTKAGATEAVTPTPLPQRTPDQLVGEIESARADLERSLAELKAATAPKALVERSKNGVVGFFTDEYGGVRVDRVAIVAGSVVGLVLFRRWRRSRRRCYCR